MHYKCFHMKSRHWCALDPTHSPSKKLYLGRPLDWEVAMGVPNVNLPTHVPPKSTGNVTKIASLEIMRSILSWPVDSWKEVCSPSCIPNVRVPTRPFSRARFWLRF